MTAIKRAYLLAVLAFLAVCAPASAQFWSGQASSTGPGLRSEIVPGQPDGFGFPDYPFLNLFKAFSASIWTYGDQSVGLGYATPNELDANGWPLYTTVAHIGWSGQTVNAPQQYARPGNYAYTWTGAGKLNWFQVQKSQLNSVSCTGQDDSDPSFPRVTCDNTACSDLTGYIAGTTLTVTVASSWTGTGSANCNLVPGQPISGAGITVTKFGTPTIITGQLSGTTGGIGTYTVNFSQTVGSSGSQITIHPGGRGEFSITGEIYNFATATYVLGLPLSGQSTDTTNTVQNIGFYYTCLNTGNCSGADDEAVYWTGQIGGTNYISTLATMKIGSFRDLGWVRDNDGPATTWSMHKPASYYQWDGGYFPPSLYAGTTTHDTSVVATFTGQISGVTLTVSGTVTGTVHSSQYLDENAGVGSGSVVTWGAGAPSVCSCTGTGGTGTYTIQSNSTVGPEAMTVTAHRYKVSFSASPPQDKDTVMVTWDATAPNPSTFMFSADGGTTYKYVRQPAGAFAITNLLPVAGSTSTLVFEAEFDAWMIWGTANTNDMHGIDENVPPEVLVEMAAEIGQAEGAVVSPWFTLPYLAADPITDWTTQEAIYVKTNHPEMVPIFESPNEIWNGGTPLSIYFRTKTTQHGVKDQQSLTTTAAASSGTSVLTFASVPSYIQVGTTMYDFTNPSAIYGLATVVSKTSTTVTISVPLTGNVGNGDQIGFAWYGPPTLGAAFLGVKNEQEAGLVASTMCQAVAAVYNSDTSRYRCTSGVNTPGELPRNADARLGSFAFIGQNPANLPIPSGCAGANAIQTLCPTPFQAAAAYNYLTHIDGVTYWNIGECACTGAGYDPAFTAGPAWPQEVTDAYNYFNGSTATQTSIMTRYVASWNNPSLPLTIANYDQVVYPAWYSWATTCGLPDLSPSACHVKGVLFYEGSYSTCIASFTAFPNDSACAENTAGGDRFVQVSAASSGGSGVCNLATSQTVNGSISNGSGGAGNQLVPSHGTTELPQQATITSGATGTPHIIGIVDTANGYNQSGYVIDGAAQLVNSGTFTVAANGAVAGMTVAITAASGGSWGNVLGGTYTVQASGLTQSNIPINLDCSGLGSLGLAVTGAGSNSGQVQLTVSSTAQMANRDSGVVVSGVNGTTEANGTWTISVDDGTHITLLGSTFSNAYTSGGNVIDFKLTYIGSVQYVNFLRAMSWSAPDQEGATHAMCVVAGKYGGGGCSQLNFSGIMAATSAWMIASPDAYGYNPIGTSTASTVSGTTLTLAGLVVPVTAGSYNSSTGIVTLTLNQNANGYTLVSGPMRIAGASGTGSFASINGNIWGYVNGSTLTYTIASGLTMTISGANADQVGPPFQVGQHVVGTGIPFGTTITGILTGTGKFPGDTLSLSTNAGTITAEKINGTTSGTFPSVNGYKSYNTGRSNQGYLLKRDLGANDNDPAWVAVAA